MPAHEQNEISRVLKILILSGPASLVAHCFFPIKSEWFLVSVLLSQKCSHLGKPGPCTTFSPAMRLTGRLYGLPHAKPLQQEEVEREKTALSVLSNPWSAGIV